MKIVSSTKDRPATIELSEEEMKRISEITPERFLKAADSMERFNVRKFLKKTCSTDQSSPK